MGNTEKPGVVNHTRAALPSDPLQVPRTSGRRETWLMDSRVEQRAPRPHDRMREIVITQRTRPQAYCMGSHGNSPDAGRHFRYADHARRSRSQNSKAPSSGDQVPGLAPHQRLSPGVDRRSMRS
jgi:hypothetical protein